MKILIGVDDSLYSKAALDHVKSMKWPSGTTCVVVSAATPQVAGHKVIDIGGITWIQEAKKDITERAQELIARVERELQDVGLETEARVVHGDPREVLVEAAKNLNADLVVIGSHGRTGLEKLMMGSVASHVVAHAPCSVTVVKLRAP